MNKLNLNYFKGLVVVASPGKYNLKVRSVTPYENRFIVGLDAISVSSEEKIQQMLDSCQVDTEGNTNISISDVPTISGNVWSSNEVPVKGEFVTAYIDYVDTKEGKDLRVIKIVAQSIKPGNRLNLTQFDKQEDNTPLATSEVKQVEPELVITSKPEEF